MIIVVITNRICDVLNKSHFQTRKIRTKYTEIVIGIRLGSKYDSRNAIERIIDAESVDNITRMR